MVPANAEGSKRSRRMLATAAGLAFVGLLAWLFISERSGEFRAFDGEAMATRWRIELPDRAGAATAAEESLQLLRRLDLELSEWKPGSPLSAVNRAAGRTPVAVPEGLFDLVRRSLEIGRQTDGAFDVSWAALWGLWDFRSSHPVLPSAAAVAGRARLVDYRTVELDPARRTIFLPRAGMQLGLGGVGKGYALGRVATLLAARGFDDFLLVGGGQVLARGNHGGRPWRVGIRDPRGAPDDYFATVELDDASLSTSADDESYFVVDGVRYQHILDPRTGWPARGLRSATVLDRDPTLADALSTAVMVLGRDRGLEVARRLGAQALVVDDHGEVGATPGFEARIRRLHAPVRSSD